MNEPLASTKRDGQGNTMRELIDHLGYVPKSCVWEITRACNLACAHCGTNSSGKPRPDELDTDACVDLVHQLAALGNKHITLSGGEPTLRRDWPTIARAAIECKITVNIVTNGQSNPARLSREAREAGVSNLAISLDGLEATHDAIRSSGAFTRATENIRVLAEAGHWVDVMMTVNRLNLEQVSAVYELAGRLGARGFRLQLGKPMGKQTLRHDMTLEPHHLLTLLPLLGELASRPGPYVRMGDSIGYFSPAERVVRGKTCGQGHWTGCYAGCQAIGIQSDGSIKGCLSLQPREGEEDPFIEGNVREKSLAFIWMRKGAFAYNRAFEVDQLDGACAKCSHAALCRGGAKCVAHAYTGGMSHDPMCFLAACVSKDPSKAPDVWPSSGKDAAAAIRRAVRARQGVRM